MAFREDPLLDEYDRSILVVATSGEVAGIDRDTGFVVWTNELKDGGFGHVYLGFRYGVLAVSASSKLVFRLDYQTGETLWRARTEGSGRATIVVEHDRVVVAKGGYVDCYDHDGHSIWQQGLKGMGFGGIALAFPSNVAQSDDSE